MRMETKTENKVFDRELFVKNGRRGGKISGPKNAKKPGFMKWVRSHGTKKKPKSKVWLHEQKQYK